MRFQLSTLLLLTLATASLPAVADDDFDDLDFGIEEGDLDWDATRGPEDLGGDPDEEDLFGLDSDPVEDIDSDPIEDFDVIEDGFEAYEDEGDHPLVGLGEELGLDDMGKAERVEAGATTSTVQLDVVGKEPLADNYPVRIVVIELPVLLGRSRAGFEGQAYWLQADVKAGELTVATAVQWVGKASLAEFGPSFAFFELMVPVQSSAGELRIDVQKLDQLGAAGAPLFTRTVAYSLR